MADPISSKKPTTPSTTNTKETDAAKKAQEAAAAAEKAKLESVEELAKDVGLTALNLFETVPVVGTVIGTHVAAGKAIYDFVHSEPDDTTKKQIDTDIRAMNPGDSIEITRSISVKSSALFSSAVDESLNTDTSVDDVAKMLITRTAAGWEVKTELSTAATGEVAKGAFKGKVTLGGEHAQVRTFTTSADLQFYLAATGVASAYLPSGAAAMVDAAIPGGELKSMGFKVKAGIEGNIPLDKLEELGRATQVLNLSLKAADDGGVRVDAGPPPAMVLTSTFAGEAAGAAITELVGKSGSNVPLLKGKASITVEQSFPLPAGMTAEDAARHPLAALEQAQLPGKTSVAIKAEAAPAKGTGALLELKYESGPEGMHPKSAKVTTFDNAAAGIDVKTAYADGKLGVVDRQQTSERVWDGHSDIGAFLKSSSAVLFDRQALLARAGLR